jgi:hypothetical protein
MDVPEAVNRWNELLERTFQLWEDYRELRREAETATEVRGGSFATLGKVAEYAGALEVGIRRAMDDAKNRHGGERRGLTGEDWFKRMDELLGPEEGSDPEGPDPDDPRGAKGT